MSTIGPPEGVVLSNDPDTRSWRTCEGCLDGGWETYSETWPRSGMTRSGTAYQLLPSVPLTSVTGRSFWPTPTARLGSARGSQPGRYFDPARSNSWELRPAQSGVGRGVDGFSAGLDGSWGIDWGDGLERVARGVPARLDRLRALGNAVVPQVAQFVGELIMEGES